MKRSIVFTLLVGALLGWIGLEAIRYVYIPEWQSFQTAYNRMQREKGWPEVEEGLRSLKPPASSTHERCVTCHLGMVLPYAHQAPFQRHPPLPCGVPVAELGCVSCHRGQAWGVNLQDAHGLTKSGVEKLLDWKAGSGRKKLLQPGCAQCHMSRNLGRLKYDDEIVPGVADGLRLFITEGCISCHHIDGVYNHRESGPRLTHIGLTQSREEIVESLRYPQRKKADSPMPPLILPKGEVQHLVLFLMAQVGQKHMEQKGLPPLTSGAGEQPDLLDHFEEELPESASSARGALWARRLGCKGCHRLGEDKLGIPDLTHVGWYATKTEFQSVLRQPEAQTPESRMPAYDLPKVLTKSLVLYLGLQRLPLPSTPEHVFFNVCGRCHGERRDPKIVVLAQSPPLFSVGKCTLKQEQFEKALTTIRRPSAMPPWRRIFSSRFIDGLYRAFCNQRGDHAR